MKIQNLEDISDIFSIFHDGIIVENHFKNNILILSVEIEYLAERIHSTFTQFEVTLYGFNNVAFSTWPARPEAKPEKLTNIQTILMSELLILESNLIKDNRIEVICFCNQPSDEYDYGGGELSFTVDSAEVKDEAGKFYTIDELDELCKSYWNRWEEQNDQYEN
ncbi:hypothetical protein [Candidatus Albibeggiatoa sp. nov. NOAA]|uniref:hypothetical protein n=1 Tax=Candidatus Albibeggiatoa sp. nov. NOAA TaxID=3162724 RepID=UPI0032F71C35|nr:hypothetical protein [Thiotrichaceae bacterium]